MTQTKYRISVDLSFYDDDIPDGFLTELEFNPIPNPTGSVLDEVYRVIDKLRLEALNSIAENIEYELQDQEALRNANINVTVEAL